MQLRRTAVLIALTAGAMQLAGPSPAAPSGFGFLGTWGTRGAAVGQFELPDGIAVDARGTVWVADRDRNRIEHFTARGRYLRFAPFRSRHLSSAPGRFNLPYDLAIDGAGRMYVADTHNHRIQVFNRRGKLIRRWGRLGTAPGEFDQPRAIALDPQGDVWVADHENKRVQKFTPGGRFLAEAGGFNSPRGLSSDAHGNVYVADDANHRVVELANDGSVVRTWGHLGTGDGEFTLPYSTAVDRFGHVWVTDTNNNRIQEFTADGTFVARFGANGGDSTPGSGPGEFDHPYDLAFDRAGNLYVTDQGNKRVEKFGVR
jgi:sugar lactone lactonase YvrE